MGIFDNIVQNLNDNFKSGNSKHEVIISKTVEYIKKDTRILKDWMEQRDKKIRSAQSVGRSFDSIQKMYSVRSRYYDGGKDYSKIAIPIRLNLSRKIDTSDRPSGLPEYYWIIYETEKKKVSGPFSWEVSMYNPATDVFKKLEVSKASREELIDLLIHLEKKLDENLI